MTPLRHARKLSLTAKLGDIGMNKKQKKVRNRIIITGIIFVALLILEKTGTLEPLPEPVIFALFEEEMCVCDIAESLSMTQSAISHQLRILKQSKLVGNRREGKQIIYFLADDHVRTIIDQGLNHIEE